MRLLVVNAGSSTLKLSVLDGDILTASSLIETSEGGADEGALSRAISMYGPFDAVGHRVVHGGTELTKPVLVDDEIARRLAELTRLAPLHQPKSLAALHAVSALLPGVPAVACFDTAFHADLPPEAFTYAIPGQWREQWGVRRFGFHGLSHSYASRRAKEMALPVGTGAPSRVVTCHLGAGASLAAVLDGKCVDTTMGFTPLEGLVMATRSGTVDPGLVLWLAESAGLSTKEISEQLQHHSGLSALAGTSDMRQVLAREQAGDERASLAAAVYVHRLSGQVASMVASLGGIDVLVFTGGVGENAAQIRAWVASRLGFLGIAVDDEANSVAEPDCEVSDPQAAVRTLVVAAREDLEIARQVGQVLNWPGGGS